MKNTYLSKDRDRNIVYIKEVMARDVSASIDMDVLDTDRVFALHDANGAQLAVAANRQLALYLAHANDLEPMTVH
jgi:hypothetical protein